MIAMNGREYVATVEQDEQGRMEIVYRPVATERGE